MFVLTDSIYVSSVAVKLIFFFFFFLSVEPVDADLISAGLNRITYK